MKIKTILTILLIAGFIFLGGSFFKDHYYRSEATPTVTPTPSSLRAQPTATAQATPLPMRDEVFSAPRYLVGSFDPKSPSSMQEMENFLSDHDRLYQVQSMQSVESRLVVVLATKIKDE